MLLLSRKKDEVIVIGGNIRVVVIEICGNKVRLGIDAPENVSINRLEVHDAIESSRIADAEDATDGR